MTIVVWSRMDSWKPFLSSPHSNNCFWMLASDSTGRDR